MFHIKILTVAKTKEPWLEEAIASYMRRLSVTFSISWVYAKDDGHLVRTVEKERRVIGLDSSGTMMSSEQFSVYVKSQLEEGGCHLAFVIGGPDGLPSSLKETLPLVSLSRLTFTHQLARLILIEQLYRTEQILKGTPYHK